MKRKLAILAAAALTVSLAAPQLLASGGNCYECGNLKCSSSAAGLYSNCDQSPAGCIAYGACELD